MLWKVIRLSVMFRKLCFLFTVLTSLAASRRHSHFYRRDYTYFEEYDAFYKLHWDMHGVSWNSAFMACDDEGAQLFYPKEDGEWAIVKNLTKNSSLVPNVTEIFVGIHDEYGLGEYITIDGHVTPSPLGDEKVTADGQHCVVMDIETGMYKIDVCNTPSADVVRPFVCKKIDGNPCPTIDRDYVYEKVTKKCYKVNSKLKTWQESLQTCFMEGGVLLTIDSDAESKMVYDKLKNTRRHFIGFRRPFSGGVDYYTVKGQKVQDNGFYAWYAEDGDSSSKGAHDCGAIRKYGNQLYYAVESCDNVLPFVCEMEARF